MRHVKVRLLALSILALRSCGIVQHAFADTTHVYEVPATLGTSHAEQSAFQSTTRPSMVESLSLSLSSFIGQKATLVGSTTKAQRFDARIPNVELAVISRPFYTHNQFRISALAGVGFALLQRDDIIRLPTGSQNDLQNLYQTQASLGAQAELASLNSRRLTIGLRMLAGPIYAFSDQSLSSDGRNYWGLGTQSSLFGTFGLTEKSALGLSAGYRTARLSEHNDNGLAASVWLLFSL